MVTQNTRDERARRLERLERLAAKSDAETEKRLARERARHAEARPRPGGQVVEFFLASEPGVKGNTKKILKFKNQKTGKMLTKVASTDRDKAIEETLKARVMYFRPRDPLRGPILLSVTFVMPIPPSWSEWKKEAAAAGLAYPVTGKDRGNMLKLIEDALEGPFYGNDAQIVDGPVRKRYGITPGYDVRIEELDHVGSFAEWKRRNPPAAKPKKKRKRIKKKATKPPRQRRSKKAT